MYLICDLPIDNGRCRQSVFWDVMVSMDIS